ncbi:MAG: hypothetical protein K8T89_03160 [Planctomycetes bacterium]|nr:hypothetical protein [Planctomycetota bacterium]
MIRLSPEAPCCDDWALLVPVLTGDQSVNAQFIWAQDNEHRVPLIKAILIPLVLLTNGEFQVENYLNVALMGLTAAMLIRLARRLRGRAIYADAFIPMALLHLGHAEIFTFRLTLNHTLAMVLTTAIGGLIVSRREVRTMREIVYAGLILWSLPWCGANGLPVVLAGAAWLAIAVLASARSKETRSRATLMVGLAVAIVAVLLVLLYFAGYQSVAGHTEPADLKMFISGTLQCLTRILVPYSKFAWPWVSWLIPLLLFATIGLLLVVGFRFSQERVRVLGLLLFLGAMIVVAMGISYGRAIFGVEACMVSRYGTILTPILLGIYAVWCLYGPVSVRETAPMIVFTVFALGFGLQTQQGLVVGTVNQESSQSFLRDVRAGTQADYVASRYAGVLYPLNMVDLVCKQLPKLRDAGIDPYMHHPKETQFGDGMELAPTPIEVAQMTWDGKIGEGVGTDPYAIFRLDQPRFVRALRIRFVLTKGVQAPASMQFFWMCTGVNQFHPNERNVRFAVLPIEREQTRIILIDDTIDQIRLDPDDGPCRIEIRELAVFEK